MVGGLEGGKVYTRTLCFMVGGLEGSKEYTRTLCHGGWTRGGQSIHKDIVSWWVD